MTLAFCQDVQAEAYDYPESFFAPPRSGASAASPPTRARSRRWRERLRAAKAPLIVAGGGVLYAGAEAALAGSPAARGVPVAETQAGKGALAWDHPQALGAIGVTGTSAANAAAAAADLVIGIGTRLQDFTTGSRALFASRTARWCRSTSPPSTPHKHGARAGGRRRAARCWRRWRRRWATGARRAAWTTPVAGCRPRGTPTADAVTAAPDADACRPTPR